MFFTPSPSSIERTTEISNISDSNTTETTAGPTTFGNFPEPNDDDDESSGQPEKSNGSLEIPTNTSYESTSVPDISVHTSKGPDRNQKTEIPPMIHPESTTHRQTPPHERKNGWRKLHNVQSLKVFEI